MAARPSAHWIISLDFAASVLRYRTLGCIPTRPISRRSESQQVWIVVFWCLCLSVWSAQASKSKSNAASERLKHEPRNSRANSAPRCPWPGSVPSLTLRESWKTAKRATTCTSAAVCSASLNPFSSTRAQWITPCSPSIGRAYPARMASTIGLRSAVIKAILAVRVPPLTVCTVRGLVCRQAL